MELNRESCWLWSWAGLPILKDFNKVENRTDRNPWSSAEESFTWDGIIPCKRFPGTGRAVKCWRSLQGGCELECMMLEEVMSWVCSIWRRLQGEPYYCRYLHLPQGEVTGRMVRASQRWVMIRGNRHKFDLGYAWRGRKSNPEPELLPEETWESPWGRFRLESTSARNSSSIVLALKLGARPWLFQFCLSHNQPVGLPWRKSHLLFL